MNDRITIDRAVLEQVLEALEESIAITLATIIQRTSAAIAKATGETS